MIYSRFITAGFLFLNLRLVGASSAADIDQRLRDNLRESGFTGRIESTLVPRLGRPVNPQMAELGRLLFFDTIHSLHDDNTCAGCHTPNFGFSDSQSIAIGVQNNGLVGLHRSGPRNQRRTPSIVNTAFYPKLMWNGRFSTLSGDPFNNSLGFLFPPPEGATTFAAHDLRIRHLLQAQGQLPPTELVEAAGFTGTAGTIGPQFDQFDDGKGGNVPPPDSSGFRNEPIRQAVLMRLNAVPKYRELFGALFPEVARGGRIDFSMFGRAIAEFEFTQVFANAPIDRYARGDDNALNANEKQGALIFFGKGRCVACHAVGGQANEMFSDFQNHNIAVPQIAPFFGIGIGNVIFDGPGRDEDFGAEQITGNSSDRYKFRSSPLRNVALQPAFFHNGSFTRLEDAIRHHLNVFESVRNYDPVRVGVAKDITFRLGPMEDVLATVDPLITGPLDLGHNEFEHLVAFVRNALLDPRATPASLCRVIPDAVPSGRQLLRFEGCTAVVGGLGALRNSPQ